MVAVSQLGEVKRLLESKRIRYWIEENAISWEGAPYVAVINLGRDGDADAVQAILIAAGPRVADLNAAHDPAGWFKYLDDKVKLGCPTEAEIARITEVKASRDMLVHSRGVAGKTYESKAGKVARYKDGQRIDIPEYYHSETWELLRKVATDISNAVIAKVP